MPRYIRSFVPGGTYFFTVALADRESHLLVREIQRLRAAYAQVQRRHPFETLAISVMPEHLHALWQMPAGDADFPLRWQQIKSGFSEGLVPSAARSKSQITRRERGIWQRRFWEHQIRDGEDFARHVDYIHFNPVKHACAKQVRDWPFSSFHRWVRRGICRQRGDWSKRRAVRESSASPAPRRVCGAAAHRRRGWCASEACTPYVPAAS